MCLEFRKDMKGTLETLGVAELQQGEFLVEEITNKNNKNGQPLKSASYVPDPVLSPLHILTQLILTQIQWGGLYHDFNFTACETKSFFWCVCVCGWHSPGLWKFLGQGSNWHHSSDLSYCSDNDRSLTGCSTRELHETSLGWFKLLALSHTASQ